MSHFTSFKKSLINQITRLNVVVFYVRLVRIIGTGSSISRKTERPIHGQIADVTEWMSTP